MNWQILEEKRVNCTEKGRNGKTVKWMKKRQHLAEMSRKQKGWQKRNKGDLKMIR